MANNPLYPGYQPRKNDEESINPLYPGYYTGKPLPRIPQSREYLQPIEYNVDEIMEEIDGAARKVLLAPLAGPRWVKDRIVDDWTKQFKASTSPEGGLNVTELDDYNITDHPGASTTLSLNPKEWGVTLKGVDLEKTKRKALSTLDGWYKETTGINRRDLIHSDFSDIENKVNEKLWSVALGYGRDDATFGQKVGAAAVSDRVTARFKDHRGTSDPLSIKDARGPGNTDIIEYTIDGKKRRYDEKDDLYRRTAKNAADFILQRDNAKDRDKLHTSFVIETLNSANIEIQDALIKRPAAMAAHSGAIQFFDLRVRTLTEMSRLQHDSDGVAGTNKTLKKIVTGASTDDPGQKLRTLKANVAQAKIDIGTKTTAAQTLFRTGSISERKSLDRYIDHLKIYEKHLDYLEKNIDEYNSNQISLKQIIKILDGNMPNRHLTKRGVFKDSLAGGLMKDLEYGMLSKGRDEIGNLLGDTGVVAAGVDLNAKKLRPLTWALRQDRRQYAAKELLNAWDEENLMEKFVWKAMKDVMPERLSNFVSGQWIGNSLARTNYFGLKIEERGTPDKNSWRRKRFDKKYGYKVKVEVDPILRGTLGIGVGKRYKFRGGDHFDIFGNQYVNNTRKFFNNLTNPNQRRHLTDLFKVNKTPDANQTPLHDLIARTLYGGASFAALRTDDQNKLLGYLQKGGPLGHIKNRHTFALMMASSRKMFGVPIQDLNFDRLVDLNLMIGDMAKFNSWVNTQKFGSRLSDDQKIALFESFRKKNRTLNDGYKLNREHIGRLEKLNNKLNDLQKKFQNSAIGKSIAFISNWKDIAAEKIAAAISKLVSTILSGVVTVGSSGFLAALAPFLKAATEFLIKKTLVYGEAFLQGLLKWDFEKLADLFRKDLEKVMKSCLVVGLVIFMGVLLPTMALFGLITTIISPIDSTRDTGTSGSSMDVCAVAAEYNMDCCILEAIWNIETGGSEDGGGTKTCGKFDCCNFICACGPFQVMAGLYAVLGAGENIDLCDPGGGAILASRLLLLKLCQADGVCLSYDWTKYGDYVMQNYQVTADNYATEYYYGCMSGECVDDPCTNCRWGAGWSYQMAVQHYCSTGSIPPDANDPNSPYCIECFGKYP